MTRTRRPLARRIAVAVVLALSATTIPRPSPASADSGGDPDGSRDLAEAGRLPEGDGLAAGFVADRGVAGHPDVVFADDFEADARIGSTWDETRDDHGKVLSIVDESAEDPRVGSKSLKVTARLGENTGGGLTTWFESSEVLFIRFLVKFDPDCDYVHHFVTLRANRGLTGRDRWTGFGGAGVKPKGHERFSTAIEPWGDWGKNPPPGEWNFYSYWHEMEASPDGKFWGNAFRPAEQPGIPRGDWICVEFMLKHNTPGMADGEQAYWIDGELRGHWGGINWRDDPGLTANALTLESYVTDRWTENPVNVVLFDDVVIARSYVGPPGLP
ncbi:hypothetical protein [Tautonia plasticadhaerens]|uniref:GH16 domain-containing protein n=1 Tax=Tautonia plasticadhaerens TaxID=2527974 RepID=A0A518HDE7_9BACT|nr:hypothetical protein [Tautonia plasticadhaerens]QDV38843.1 hypothetical protein ElP_68010 [Tautonia plasticadhaerens]